MYDMDRLLPVFKGLADETRLQILSMLTEGKKCACRINDAFACSQPTISYHMRVLTEAGLVSARRDGALMCYELKPGVWEALGAFQAVVDQSGKEDAG